MRFLVFSSFLQKLAFQRFKNQLKNYLFIPVFDFLAFQLEKPADRPLDEKRENMIAVGITVDEGSPM
jgi:hypothetical protein